MDSLSGGKEFLGGWKYFLAEKYNIISCPSTIHINVQLFIVFS
jgi:hypothetical protein